MKHTVQRVYVSSYENMVLFNLQVNECLYEADTNESLQFTYVEARVQNLQQEWQHNEDVNDTQLLEVKNIYFNWCIE